MEQAIFLTGATGLLGRYLLRDLLASGRRVGVLIRDSQRQTAAERLDDLLAFASESLDRELPRPMLLHGDLRKPGLGLDTADRHWLASAASAVIHAAAYVAYQPTPEGEPWETNVNGLYRLLELCRSVGATEVHHLSTAFLCGDRRGTVYEDQLDLGEGTNNAYEQSKFAAEQLLRDFPGIQATVYRPSIVVGDSRTGYTSTYHHFYRFLELGARLSSRSAGSRARRQNLSLRLPVSGEEVQNFVPVDWVSQAIVELVHQPRWHGRTYHLVARQPLRLCEITDMMAELLHFEGLQWVGSEGLSDPTVIEQMVCEQFRDYWSYLRANLTFDCRNTREALPHLPPPVFDGELMARLLCFARQDGWGRTPATEERTAGLARYLQHLLPARMRRSSLAQALPPGLLFALDVRGLEGGQWLCRCGDGTMRVQRGVADDAVLTYRVDAPTLESLIRGVQTARQAFFDGRIEIDGDMEKAIKLAMLLEQFLGEDAHRSSHETEKPHALVGG
jgi:thioester reductase-like protein